MRSQSGWVRGMAVILGSLGMISLMGSVQSQEDGVLEQKATISRYELSYRLEQLHCRDCLHASPETITTYGQTRFQEAANNPLYLIDDIVFREADYQSEEYYYCVASAVDAGTMNGFPKTVTPRCHGKFCGANASTYADVVPALYHTLAPYIYEFYTVPRNDVFARAETSPSISLQQRGVLVSALEACQSTGCSAESPEELTVYIHYCADNLGVCGFQAYPDFKQGNILTAYINVLNTYQIIDRSAATILSPETLVSGKALADMLRPMRDLLQCNFNTDYDGDGIVNVSDTCPNAYNPTQDDFDADGKGDVCDDDLENDGVVNPAGIVDFNGNFQRAVREQFSGSAQSTLQDILEGEYFLQGEGVALQIDGTPRAGESPLTISFTGTVSGTIDEVVWDMGDGTSKKGIAVMHTYDQSGKYTVTATAVRDEKPQAVSAMVVEVAASVAMQVGYQILTEDLTVVLGQTGSFNALAAGSIRQATWQISDDLITGVPNAPIAYGFTQPGMYFVESQAYNPSGERVGVSQMTLDVVPAGSSSRGSYLRVNALTPTVGTTVTFETQTEGFSEDEIETVRREFGDESVIETSALTLSKQYSTPGSKVIHQYIVFKDSTIPIHENVITLHVIDVQRTRSAHMQASDLIVNQNDEIAFTISLSAIAPSDIASMVRMFDDGTKRRISPVQRADFAQLHTYEQPGSYIVTAHVYLRDGTVFSPKVTIIADDSGLCSGAMTGLRCDMDTDGLPDLCDDDIDGDGKGNRIGLYIRERADCTYTEAEEGASMGKYHDAIKKGASFDNCPITINQDQKDSDKDGYGEVCDSNDTDPAVPQPESGNGENGGGDTDGDGIPDDEDACPTIPENKNGQEDADGCPEIPGSGGDGNGGSPQQEDPFIRAKNCKQCPCPYADYASSLRKLDRVTAELRDETGTIKYRVTDPMIIERDIPDEMLGR